MRRNSELEEWFPKLKNLNYNFTTSNYDFNCLSYSLGITNKWIWLNENWDISIPRVPPTDGIRKLFERNGYKITTESIFVSGIDKVAIYEMDGRPTHVAKQNVVYTYLNTNWNGYLDMIPKNMVI